MSVGRRVPALVVLSLVLVLGAVVRPANPAHAAVVSLPGLTEVTTTGPLSLINVGQDTTLQAVDNRVSNAGEFYPTGTTCTGDFGVWVTIGSTVYGPSPTAAWHCPDSVMDTPTVVYQPVSQTVSGTGGGAPFTVTTTVRLTPSITLTQTIYYAPGQTFFQETDQLNNTGAPVPAKIFDGAEPDPGSFDPGIGYHDPVSTSVGASNPVSQTTGLPYSCTTGPPSPYQYSVYFSPVTPWQHSVVDWYYNVFADIQNSSTGASLPDTFNTTCIDPAMAVEWDVTLGSSVSLVKDVNFTSNLPVGHPGTVRGAAQCTFISPPGVTCTTIAPTNCPACGSSYSFLVPITCTNAPPINLHERPCTGAMTGHIGLLNFSMPVSSGDLEPTANGGATATLHGTATFNPFGLNGPFTITATDNDVTGVDTVVLTVAKIVYQWTCRTGPSCLEISLMG